jgi:PTH1 family peptidyl-tRNA hydrolase
MIQLFVGLGNPGPEYEATRHNAGFWWIEALARQLGARLTDDRTHKGRLARVAGPQGPVWLLQPMTFMNRSGTSVAPLARFYKIDPAASSSCTTNWTSSPARPSSSSAAARPGTTA